MNQLAEIDNTLSICHKLMQTPHYSKIGLEGISAIVMTAKSLGLDPMTALGGGLYYVRGKVEMSSRAMGALIRSRKHSVTKDKRSDDTICILHGRRADNGDTWCESFSMAEAQRAGLTKSTTWQVYARDMLFARALSRLARQLFPDVIGNVYVEGEISSLPAEATPEVVISSITPEQADNVDKLIGSDEAYRKHLMDFLAQKFNVYTLQEMPLNLYDKVLARIAKNKEEANAA
jgi:hypothetical protein